jgi:putative FmdB family regulatory protein
MPIYSYTCPECGPFTKLVKMDDRDNVKCDKGHDAKRGIDRPGGVYAPTATGGRLRV